MKNKFNKEFEDLAWSQMQKMLDQEMPVAEKKRRRGIFWLFLLSGCIAVGGVVVYLKNKAEKVEKAQIMPIANKELIVENRQLNTPINSIKNAEINNNKGELINNNKRELNVDLEKKNNKIEQQIIIQSSDNNKDESTLTSAAVTNTPVISAPVASTPVTRAIFTVALDTNVPLDAGTRSVTDTALVTNFTNPQSVADLPLDSGKLPTQTPPQYVSENKEKYKFDTAEQGEILTKELILPLIANKLGKINSIDSLGIALEKINMPIIIKNIIKNNVNHKTHLSVILGVHTEGGKKVDGGQFGVITHTNLGRKSSFFAGINYRKSTVQVDSSSDALVGYRAVSTTTTTTNLTPVSLALIPVKKIILNQLNYLELPIGINYSFNKKMSISVGIKAAYLLSTKVDISADSSVFFLKEIAAQKSSYTVVDLLANNSIAQLGLNRWDFAAIGGLNYSLTKRFQLGVRYDYGLNSVVKRANWTAYNRFLGVNVVYLLK